MHLLYLVSSHAVFLEPRVDGGCFGPTACVNFVTAKMDHVLWEQTRWMVGLCCHLSGHFTCYVGSAQVKLVSFLPNKHYIVPVQLYNVALEGRAK